MARIPYPETLDPTLNLLPAPLNVFRMVSHAGPLLSPFAGLGMSNLQTSTLSPRLRELVILLVARECRCEYVRVQHVPIALDAGVTPAELTAIAGGSTVGGSTVGGSTDPMTGCESEQAALSAALEMFTEHTWSGSTVILLQKHFTDRQIVELATTVGYYTMLSGIVNGLDIDVDPSGERFTELANRRR